jgi:endonuclease-8
LPEGDTIHRTAATLQKALGGKVVTRYETMLPKIDGPLRGRTIERVAAVGKNLVIDFSGGLHLRTHMRMNGAWHIYRPGERWQRPRRDMRVVIETADFVAVGFNIPVAELLTGRELERALHEQGPDLLADFDIEEAVRRAREHRDEEIANVLLNQRVAAGIGNIWKSESLFVRGINPFRKVKDVEELEKLFLTARALLKESAAGHRRLNVYSRGGQPCRKCGTAILSRKQGLDARLTYWCPRCQPLESGKC